MGESLENTEHTDRHYRFQPGNKAACGRSGSYAQQRAALRTVFMREITEEKLVLLVLETYATAMGGGRDAVAAQRLLYAYCLGAPTLELHIREDLDDSVQKARAELAARALGGDTK